MFKFDFLLDVDNNNPFNTTLTKEKESDNNTNPKENFENIEWHAAEKFSKNVDVENLDFCKLNSIESTFGATCLRHLVAGFLLDDIKTHAKENDDIKIAEKSHSDLIPGVYEGGAKIWECTDDLLKYLADNYLKNYWSSKNVLDLGCGSGLLGIYAIKNDAAMVHFQDYNKDVLEKVTLPNILMNISNETESNEEHLDDLAIANIELYSGDWSSFTKLTTDDERYDIILTSETIYNPQNQSKLLNTFHSRLKSNGVVFVAAKSYYFGVGGGLRQFEQLISIDKRFQSRVLWVSDQGLNREILELKFLAT